MNITVKSVILDTVISALITLAGGGNFYSFLFFFVVLFLPAILVFVAIDIKDKGSPSKITNKKK